MDSLSPIFPLHSGAPNPGSEDVGPTSRPRSGVLNTWGTGQLDLASMEHFFAMSHRQAPGIPPHGFLVERR